MGGARESGHAVLLSFVFAILACCFSLLFLPGTREGEGSLIRFLCLCGCTFSLSMRQPTVSPSTAASPSQGYNAGM
uniref:Uncharacterized protein n=1 Tax=Anguilla anguilla TaxID=7936 RepID=A0A0E9RFY1_ANGAN